MRDFEGGCKAIFGNTCSGTDDGHVPSCNKCGTGDCWLWLSNDMWIQEDANSDGIPDNTSFDILSSSCPEGAVQATSGSQVFIAVRILLNADFFDASNTNNGDNLVYHLTVSGVVASSGIYLNNFNKLAETDISFKRTASTITLPTAGAGVKVAALASANGLKDGFVVFLPWAVSGSGHFCLLAELGCTSGPVTTKDAMPVRTTTSCVTADPNTVNAGYHQYVQCYDNVIWRNIDIQMPQKSEMKTVPMEVNPTQEQGVLTSFEILAPAINRIPADRFYTIFVNGNNLLKYLQVTPDILIRYNPVLQQLQWNKDISRIPLKDKLVFPPAVLPPGQKIPLSISFAGNAALANDSNQYRHPIHILQYEQKGEGPRQLVGGNTVLLLSKATGGTHTTPPPTECTGIRCWLDRHKWAYILAGIIVLLILLGLFRRRKP